MRLQCSYYSPVLKTTVRLQVILPLGNKKKSGVSTESGLSTQPGPLGKYQSLYLLHDRFSGTDEWLRLSCVERFAQEYHVALVMPWGENSFFRNISGGRYLDYLTGELPDRLTALFPLSGNRDDTFIAGVSMGGYGALLAALCCPHRYKAAVSLSGIVDGVNLQEFPEHYRYALFKDGKKPPKDVEGDLFLLLDSYRGREEELPMLYSSCGLEDPLLQTVEAFTDKARSVGVKIKSENFPGGHDWDYWNTMLDAVFAWLPLKKTVV
jgi:S-formylglutathione hydrolase FrmB